MHFSKYYLNTCNKPATLLLLLSFYLCTYAQSQPPVLTVPTGHQNAVTSVDFSADEKLIVTGSADNSFIIWDARTGFVIRHVRLNGPVKQVLFTPDGSQLITLAGSGSPTSSAEKPVLQQWEVKTGKMLARLPFTASPGLQFLHNPDYLLVPDYSDKVEGDGKNFLQKLVMSADNDDDYEDSIDAVAEERVMQKMGEDVDLSDPKKLKEYQKLKMDAIMEMKFGTNPFSRNITVIDLKTLKVIARLENSPENIKLLYHNNTEYLVAQNKQLHPLNQGDGNMAAWNINELISQYREKKEIKPAKTFPEKNEISNLAASSAKGFFAVGIIGKAIELWQLDKSTVAGSLVHKGVELYGMDFSPDGTILYAYSGDFPDRYIEGWNTSSLKQVFSLKLPDYYTGQAVYLSPRGNYFAVVNLTGLVKLSSYGDSTGQFYGRSGIASSFGFAPNDGEVSVNYNVFQDVTGFLKEGFEKAVDEEAAKQGKTLSKAEKDKLVKRKMDMSDPSKVYKRFALNWDLIKGGTNLQPATTAGQSRTISKDGKYVLVNQKFESAGKEGVSLLQEMIAATPKEDLNKEDADALKMLNNILNAPKDGPRILTDSLNGPVMFLINRKTADTISLINIDSTDWVMLLKSGYYMTSANGAKSLSYTRGVDVMSFEQFDVQYNRPDLVLKAIGMSDPALMEAYKNAYQKRIKKLNIDSSQFKKEYVAPEADFENRDKIAYEQKTGKLNLIITANDKKTNLNRYNVWVNEVPVFGRNGKSIKEARSNKLNTSLEITLSQGLNRIETSVINENGIESYRAPLFVKYTPLQPVEEKVYFIGIGINRFADTSHNLRYCEKDIRDLSQRLKEKYGNKIQVDLLFNNDVTLENIKLLKQKLLQSNEDDKVIIAYSGHGLLSKGYDYYLSTYNINFDKPEENGLPYDELENLVDGIKARKKLMLIDACHSGEVDKEEMQKIAAAQAELKDISVSGSKGLKLPPTPARLGMKNSFELMQELFVNVGRGTGTTVISAAAGTQFALERGDLKNGVFTYSILDAMKQYATLKVGALKKIVSKNVEELTNGLQRPTSRNETISVDWSVW